MTVEVIVQIASKVTELPTVEQLHNWVMVAIGEQVATGEITIRIVDEAESAKLNNQYRGKAQPTNVLTFPAELEPQFAYLALGDIVICAPVVISEAKQHHKNIMAHWAHMVIHGVLHLLGYTHEVVTAAEQMEALEAKLLVKLGYGSPYENY